MTAIALIGCGNIGGRLLQSLVRTPPPAGADALDIVCVDPSEDALALAQERAQEAGADAPPGAPAQVTFAPSLDAIPEDLELAILASTSKARYEIFTALMARARPRRILFEKFLFTERPAYAAVSEALETAGVRAWVHCPRPEWPGYRQLREELAGGGPIRIRVTGSGWALASNAIHFLAAFMFLTGEDIAEFDATGLDPEPLENKRGGYLEVTGALRARGTGGSSIELVCLREGRLDVAVDVVSAKGRFVVAEGERIMRVQTERTEWRPEQAPFQMRFASEMADVLARLLADEPVSLPSYQAMVEPHLALMSVYNRIFFGPDGVDRPCPVT